MKSISSLVVASCVLNDGISSLASQVQILKRGDVIFTRRIRLPELLLTCITKRKTQTRITETRTLHSTRIPYLSLTAHPVHRVVPAGSSGTSCDYLVANLAPIFLVTSAAHMNAGQSAQLVQTVLFMGVWVLSSSCPDLAFWFASANRHRYFIHIRGVITAIVATHGYGTAVGAIIIGGVLEALLGLTAAWWRTFIPTMVPWFLVVTSIGLSLLPVAAQSLVETPILMISVRGRTYCLLPLR